MSAEVKAATPVDPQVARIAELEAELVREANTKCAASAREIAAAYEQRGRAIVNLQNDIEQLVKCAERKRGDGPSQFDVVFLAVIASGRLPFETAEHSAELFSQAEQLAGEWTKRESEQGLAVASGYTLVRITDGREFTVKDLPHVRFDGNGRGTGDHAKFARVLPHEKAEDIAAIFRKRDGYGSSLEALQARDVAAKAPGA